MPTTAEWIRPADVVDDLCQATSPESGLDAEERANQITHGLGFVLSLAAAASLVPAAMQSPHAGLVQACLLYAGCMVGLYAASTLSHSFATGRRRDLFRLLDQVCIYLFIAATVTPFGVACWSTPMVVVLLGGTWLLAILGSFRKVLVEGPSRVNLPVYIGLATLPTLGIGAVVSRLPLEAGALLVGGHVVYVIGVYFWLREGRIPYSHAVWHLCVIAGTGAHFAVVRWYLVEGRLVFAT